MAWHGFADGGAAGGVGGTLYAPALVTQSADFYAVPKMAALPPTWATVMVSCDQGIKRRLREQLPTADAAKLRSRAEKMGGGYGAGSVEVASDGDAWQGLRGSPPRGVPVGPGRVSPWRLGGDRGGDADNEHGSPREGRTRRDARRASSRTPPRFLGSA